MCPTPASSSCPLQVYLGGAIMAVAELINFIVHVQLRLMPPPVSQARARRRAVQLLQLHGV